MGKTVLETPQDLYDALDSEFQFGLDVCALPYNAKCKRFYTPELDGLKQPWDANVWCNPPFDRSMGTWVRRCYEAAQAGHTAVVLIHGNYHDTAWWHAYAMKASEIRYMRGRPKFHDGDYVAALRTMVAVFRPKCSGPPICTSIDRTGAKLAPNKDSATCVNCKYWLKQSMASGECRRHAPQVVAYTESQTKGEHGEYRESVDSHTQSEWPVTPAGEWCGEYEPQNESASRSEL